MYSVKSHKRVRKNGVSIVKSHKRKGMATGKTGAMSSNKAGMSRNPIIGGTMSPNKKNTYC